MKIGPKNIERSEPVRSPLDPTMTNEMILRIEKELTAKLTLLEAELKNLQEERKIGQRVLNMRIDI